MRVRMAPRMLGRLGSRRDLHTIRHLGHTPAARQSRNSMALRVTGTVTGTISGNNMIKAFGTSSWRYAASKTAVSRPKAHTGRSTTTKRKPATTSGTKAAKKSAAKPKTAAKAKPKAVKKKTTVKKKAVPKKKKKVAKKAAPKKRKVLTEPQKAARLKKKEVEKRREQRERALLDVPHVAGGTTAWTVFNTKQMRDADVKHAGLASVVRKNAEDFKRLSAEELETLNHEAGQNKLNKAKALREWIESKTPREIYEANVARRSMSAEAAKKRAPSTRRRHAIYPSLPDPRQVVRQRSAYLFFVCDRHNSGDLKHMTLPTAASLITREWKGLSTAERETYERKAKADAERYESECQKVYGDRKRVPKARDSIVVEEAIV